MAPLKIITALAITGRKASPAMILLLGEVLHQCRKKVAIKGLTHAFPELNTKSKTRLARRSAQNQIRGLLDFLNMDKATTQLQGLEHLDNQSSNEPRGGIVLSLHLGMADAITWQLNNQGFPAKTIVGAGKSGSRKETAWVEALMQHSNCPYLTRDNSFLAKAIRELTEGNHLVFHCDMNTNGDPACFFNFPTEIPVLGIHLAKLAKVPIYFSYGFYTGNTYQQIIEPYDSRNLVNEAQSLARKMEQVIEMHPEDWVWQYNRWK